MTLRSRIHRSLALFLAFASVLLLAGAGCGNGAKDAPSPPPVQDDGNEPPARKPPGAVPGAQDGGGEGEGEGKSSITPHEMRRLEAAAEALKNKVFLNDPIEFANSFLQVRALKSIIESTKGKDAWKAMVKKAGRDELEFEKVYAKTLRDFFEDLRSPGGRCGLSEAEIRSIRNAGTPPDLLLADTFACTGERARVILLIGFRAKEDLVGVLRLRAMPHQNRRPWYYVGDERLDAVGAIHQGEAARAAEAMRTLAKAQEAFVTGKALDRDGDGKGEYAFLAELAGTREIRGTEGKIHDAGLPLLLGEVSTDHGLALSGGLLFRIYLPGRDGPVFGERGSAPEPAPLTDAREAGYCALAWPVAEGCGKGLYFMGPSGKILRARSPASFRGLHHAPPASIGFKEKAGEGSQGFGTPLDGPGTSGTGQEWEALPR